jgi:hypothetical protein
MKVLTSKKINAFGGLNFVHQELKCLNLDPLFTETLFDLPGQSTYQWSDIFRTFLSIYFCGGSSIEDAKTILLNHFGKNPFFKLCSPDTIQKRYKELKTKNQTCQTPRGNVTHVYNHNSLLYQLNLKLLKQLGLFNKETITLDYDNTIVFTEKKDSKMTYKRDYGYQPGVCILNEQYVLFVENRNGNSDAKSFQDQTLERMFQQLENYQDYTFLKFRADAASYQFSVLELLDNKEAKFYIGTRNSYVEQYFAKVEQWTEVQQGNDRISIGQILYSPFQKKYKKGQVPKQYRLLIKRKPNKTGQINAITGDAYDYRAIVTNDFQTSLIEAITFYNRRGNAEKQFDILKNDFGWNYLPFSKLEENTVFMYFSSICRNLYNVIIRSLSKRFKNIRLTDRMKRLVFTIITIPARWVLKARQWQLRVYGKIQLRI